MIADHQTVTVDLSRPARNGVRIKTIALPVEHGGWGFLLEPIVLGVLLAPSVAGVYLALSAVATFLARQPLTLLVLNRNRPSPRTALARRFAILYLVIAVSAFAAAIVFSEHGFILPLAIAAPLACVQLIYDCSGRRRVLPAEVAGAIAISSLVAALALADGWPRGASFALWAVVVARAVPSIFYVRGCLARLHRRATSPLPTWLAHVAALIVVAVLINRGVAPRLALVAMMILALRAVAGLRNSGVTPRQLGLGEIAFGAITVLAVVCGNLLGW